MMLALNPHLREGGHRDGVPKRRGRERGQAAYKVRREKNRTEGRLPHETSFPIARGEVAAPQDNFPTSRSSV